MKGENRTGSDAFRLVHASASRLRVKGRLFMDPSLDESYVRALVGSIPGVSSVRLNRAASSLVVEHARGADPGDAVLLRLQTLPEDAFSTDPEFGSGPDRFEVGARLAFAAMTPFLPQTLRGPLSWFFALPTLIRGVSTLFDEGLKVEVLDATVKFLSLLRRNYFVSNSMGALISLASYVEHSSAQKSDDLLKNLMKPQVDQVSVEKNGLETIVPFGKIVAGDTVVCGPGEMIPVDGIVTSGEAGVNMASITGEALPLHLKTGDEVLSGGVIEEGKLYIEATNVGSDTRMARIARFLEHSLRTKSKTQKESELLADRLVPLTFATGVGMYALTGNPTRATSVLTVDYSCAIKLSTPVAVRTAMYRAGRKGILLKGSQALDSLARVDTILFDKTGTLTQGSLEVTDILPLGESSSIEEVLALAAGAEEHYAHPVARAVVREAREKNLELPPASQVDFIVAHGVSAYVNGERILVGSRHFIAEDEGIDCSLVDERAEEFQAEGKSLLYIARNDALFGLMALRDTLRSESRAILAALKKEGIGSLVMVTGDHPRSARAIADLIPEIDTVYAGLKPEEKAGIIEKLKEEGRHVAFVGDGVNDSPALLNADVGICMSMGADLARDAAQVVLIRDSLEGLLEARRLARHTRSVLRRCFWTSFGINTCLLILAGSGRLSTLASAILHNSGTVGILAYASMNKGDKDEDIHP